MGYYFVWIPKYRYQLWDLGNYPGVTDIDTSKVHTIPVIFGDYNTKDEVSGECTTPMTSGSTGNCQVGDYMTHPAFLSIPSTGFWVGKFETGYDGATTTTEAEKNETNSSKIIVKPNVYSWRSINVSNAFYSTYDYKRNLDSHMMKNTEWGAVAYLQHSEYGSHTSVRINNNSNYITGFASVSVPTCGYTKDNRDCNRYGDSSNITLPYNTKTGYLASTTTNISGIYDMSGGAWEYVMGVMMDQAGTPLTGYNSFYHSEFIGPYSVGGTFENGRNWPDPKYYDKYIYRDNMYEYTRGILGDTTMETGSFKMLIYGKNNRVINSWYDNSGVFVNTFAPWFDRGGGHTDGSESGMFAFNNAWGSTYERGLSFRLILTPIL